MDSFKIKNFFGEKARISSLRLGRNRKFYNGKYILKKGLCYSPLTKNLLPKINQFNSLSITKKIPKNYKAIFQRLNINSYNLKINNKVNIIPLKNSLTIKRTKEKIKLDSKNNINPNPENNLFTFNMNNQNSLNYYINKINNQSKKMKNNNKIKELRKTINIYYSKKENMNQSDENTKNENSNQKIKMEDNLTINNQHMTKNPMFVTEMNFLINGKNKTKNRKKEYRKLKNLNYDSLSFKELLKHIENDKKKILNNQNDIDEMLKTAKDTYYEIRKCKHN